MESISWLRLLGVLFGAALVGHAFLRFRERRIGRADALMRWAVGGGLLLVALVPASVNFARDLLALESHTYGRLLALLVLSNLLVWLLLFRERAKLHALMRGFDGLVRSLTAREADTGAAAAPGGILVVLPAYNEAANLPGVLARIPKSIGGRSVRAIVVDDGSRDGTAELEPPPGHAIVSHPIRRGQGAALRLGYDLAQRLGAEVVVTMDADGQHLPEEIERLAAPILEGSKDFVVGSRLLGTRERDDAVRLLGVRVNNALINLLAGTRISDCSSGFKAIRVESLRKLDLSEDQFQAAEALIAAAHGGLRIGEVPITVRRRASGESKKGRNLSYGLNFTRTVFKAWWR